MNLTFDSNFNNKIIVTFHICDIQTAYNLKLYSSWRCMHLYKSRYMYIINYNSIMIHVCQQQKCVS